MARYNYIGNFFKNKLDKDLAKQCDNEQMVSIDIGRYTDILNLQY